MMERNLTKLYYTIGEVAEIMKVSPSLLRYWESEFQGLKPGKNRKGDRKYTKKDILYIDKIFHLVKEKGFTLEGARKELSSKKKSKGKNQLIIEKLNSIKKELQIIRSEFEK